MAASCVLLFILCGSACVTQAVRVVEMTVENLATLTKTADVCVPERFDFIYIRLLYGKLYRTAFQQRETIEKALGPFGSADEPRAFRAERVCTAGRATNCTDTSMTLLTGVNAEN